MADSFYDFSLLKDFFCGLVGLPFANSQEDNPDFLDHHHRGRRVWQLGWNLPGWPAGKHGKPQLTDWSFQSEKARDSELLGPTVETEKEEVLLYSCRDFGPASPSFGPASPSPAIVLSGSRNLEPGTTFSVSCLSGDSQKTLVKCSLLSLWYK